MKLLSLALVSILASVGPAAVLGFKLPDAGEPDGIYIHHIDANGTVTYEHLGISQARDLAASTTPASSAAIHGTRSARFRRDYVPMGTPQINCINQYIINLNDEQTVEQGLMDMFGHGTTMTDPVISYKWGTAVAYVCNRDTVTVTGTFLQAQFVQLQTICGLQSPGWVHIDSWGASYGIDQSSASVC